MTCTLYDGSTVQALGFTTHPCSRTCPSLVFAHPSERYLQIVRIGIASSGIAEDYQAWLGELRPYRRAAPLLVLFRLTDACLPRGLSAQIVSGCCLCWAPHQCPHVFRPLPAAGPGGECTRRTRSASTYNRFNCVACVGATCMGSWWAPTSWWPSCCPSVHYVRIPTTLLELLCVHGCRRDTYGQLVGAYIVVFIMLSAGVVVGAGLSAYRLVTRRKLDNLYLHLIIHHLMAGVWWLHNHLLSHTFGRGA